MKKISRDLLKEAADKTMLKLEEEDYVSLLSDFEIILQQMDFISQISGIDDLEPMVFPFYVKLSQLREDIPSTPISISDALGNAPDTFNNQISLPRVVKK